ncbi:hypothetical protein ACIQZM_09055 [Peribacillus sp. NPDC097206]
MDEKIKKECVVHFLNQPPKEQLLFVLKQSLDSYAEEKFKLLYEEDSNE